MRQLLLYLMFLLINMTCFSQTDMREGVHQFKYAHTIKQSDKFGELKIPEVSRDVEGDWQFRIERITPAGNYVIRFLKWKSDYSDANLRNEYEERNRNYYEEANGDELYFLLPAAEYTLYAEKREKKGTFAISTGTTLIKIRPGRKKPKDGQEIYSDFGNDFNIGALAGWRVKPFHRKDFTYSVLVGLGYSSIQVSSETTKGVIENPLDASAVTPSLGFVLEYNRFQLGVFSGLDIMSGKAGKNWIYKDRPWIGLGFGFTVLRSQGDSDQKR